MKVFALAIALSASNCGAPTKTAGEVAGIFDGNSQALGLKMAALCNKLQARPADQQPSLQNFKITNEDCLNAGSGLQNNVSGLKEVKFDKFKAQNVVISQSNPNEKVQNFDIRIQLWLNKSILGIVSKFSDILKQSSQNGTTNSILPASSNSGMAAGSELITSQITMVQPVKFDLERKEFSAVIDLKATGIANIEHRITAAGQLVDNAIALTIISDKQPYEKSLLNDIKIAAIIIPYANDIYIDVMIDANVHSIGVDGLVEDNLKKTISGLIKTGLDLLASTQG
jgi:hypothetical protein